MTKVGLHVCGLQYTAVVLTALEAVHVCAATLQLRMEAMYCGVDAHKTEHIILLDSTLKHFTTLPNYFRWRAVVMT